MSTFKLIPFGEHIQNFDFSATAAINKEYLYLSFTITGNLDEIDFGDYTPKHERITGLWEKTCFEFFIKNSKDHYIEFNFSPNFSWNIFYFKEVRGKLTELEVKTQPEIEILNSKNKFYLIAKFNLANLPSEFKMLDISMYSFSFNSIIVDKSKLQSFWALNHLDSKPNFHRLDSFIGKF